MKQEKLYNKYWKNDDCFPLIDKCISEGIIIDEDIFIKKGGDYNYYIKEMFGKITPYCGCGSNDLEKAHRYLYFLNKGLNIDEKIYLEEKIDDMFKLDNISITDKKFIKISQKAHKTVYDNELLYAFLDKEGLFEHGASIGGCRLTKKGRYIKTFLEVYRNYLIKLF